jgi:ferric-dicitrate binding protein FerR (iron transport regulator)
MSHSNNETDDEDLEQLLTGAGKRPEPTTDSSERAYATLKSEWQEQVEDRQATTLRRRLVSLSAAAAVTLAVVSALLWFPAGQSGSDSGSWQVQLAGGSVSLNNRDVGTAQVLRIAPEDNLRTASAVRLETATGADLRLAANSHVQWVNEHSVYLSQGSAYVDTHDRADFSINTRFGQVRDIGTRYMVVVDDQGLLVAVREGAAEVDSEFGRNTATAEAQTAALVYIDRSGVAQTTEPTSDERWNWIHAVAAGYENRLIPVVLHQIGQDLGKQIRFASRGVEATIANDTVQGELNSLHPRQALELITRSAQLSWQEDASFVTIDFIR